MSGACSNTGAVSTVNLLYARRLLETIEELKDEVARRRGLAFDHFPAGVRLRYVRGMSDAAFELGQGGKWHSILLGVEMGLSVRRMFIKGDLELHP